MGTGSQSTLTQSLRTDFYLIDELLTEKEGSVRHQPAQKKGEPAKDQLIAELQQTISNVKTLTGVLPICASCKKIREGEKWQQIETYIRDRSQVEFSHSMCPECTQLWYPGYTGL